MQLDMNKIILYIFCAISFSQAPFKIFNNKKDIDKKELKDSTQSTSLDSIINTANKTDSLLKDSTQIDMKISIENVDSIARNTLFEDQIEEAHYLFAKAMISDHTGDTLRTIYNFKLLFESLAQVDEMNDMDEFEKIAYNKLLDTAVNHFEKAATASKAESGLSVALLRDKLDQYIYDQKLEDLEFVDETVEIIEGHIPITYNGKVHSIIKFFQNDGRPSIQKWLNRTDRFKEIILPILEEEEIPPELFYLAMIESGLNPTAYSYAHASGVWQFISSTGKMYGINRS